MEVLDTIFVELHRNCGRPRSKDPGGVGFSAETASGSQHRLLLSSPPLGFADR
jgi:hypothetical protein